MADNPTGFKMEMITVSSAVKTITEATYKPITGVCAGLQPLYALITSGAAIRYTFDGTAPAATTTGHLMAAGGSIEVNGKAAIMNLKMIRESGDSVVAVTVFF